MSTLPLDTILHGDALSMLRTLPDGCVQTVVTSPPYWGLRDYGTAQWDGGDASCDHRVGNQIRDHKAPQSITSGVRPGVDASRCMLCGARRVDQQIGLEASPEEYVARMVEVFHEVRRVLRDDGTCWINLGDSYASKFACDRRNIVGNGSPDKSCKRPNRLAGDLKEKDLVGIPWMVAFALRADGWYLRSDIVWHKPNPMPESVRDRPTKAHEYLFLLAKSERYFYDAQAIMEPLTRPEELERKTPAKFGGAVKHKLHIDPINGGLSHNRRYSGNEWSGTHAGRNKRSVWTVATRPYAGAHFATMPPALVEPCVLAGTSPRACEHCGAPWQRVTQTRREKDPTVGHNALRGSGHFRETPAGPANRPGREFLRVAAVETTGWRPTCRCQHNTGSGRCLVLDPFFGSGTVGAVAKRHSRHYLGIELNATYIELAEERIAAERQPVLWTAEVSA